jgi:predicted ATPase
MVASIASGLLPTSGGLLRLPQGPGSRLEARLLREAREGRVDAPAPSVEVGSAVHPDERDAARFVSKHDSRSHGESFMDVFAQRVRPGGLYLLDEPEAPLSPKRQIAFLDLIIRGAKKQAQFIIATHSPILLACPGARIYSFDASPIAEVAYEALEHVTVTREFLNEPERFLARR